MRKNAGSLGVKIIFGVIVVVFTFWGIGGMVAGDKIDAVAWVNEDTITAGQIDRAQRNLAEAYREIYKEGLSAQMLEALNLQQRALDELIRISLMKQEAERIGLIVSDEELRSAIRGLPAFQANGTFDPNRYRVLLQRNRMTPGEFEDAQRGELLVRKLQDLVASGIQVSENEIRQQYAFESERVSLRYIRVRTADLTDQAGEPTDAEIQASYDRDREAYREPDRVRFELATYASDTLTPEVRIEESEIEAFYRDHAADYEQPETVRARHILFAIEPDTDASAKEEKRKQAEAALARARGGEDFAALARELSEDIGSKPQGGDLGSFGRGRMVKPFEDAAFALEPGGISGIVESEFGFHIIRVEEHEPGGKRPLADVRGEIEAKLRRERVDPARRETAEKDAEKARAGRPLAELAQESNGSFSVVGPLAAADRIPGVNSSAEVLSRAFATAEGEVGEVVHGANASYALRVVEKIPSRIPDLQEVREEVARKVRRKKAEELARKKAEELLAQLQASKDIDALARENDMAVSETSLFGRNDPLVPGLGQQDALKQEAFTLSAEDPVADGVYDVAGDGIVAVLGQQQGIDDAKFAEQKDTLLQQKRSQRTNVVLEHLINQLKRAADIRVRPEFAAGAPAALPGV